MIATSVSCTLSAIRSRRVDSPVKWRQAAPAARLRRDIPTSYKERVSAATARAIDLSDETATAALASALASCARRGDVIGLSGPLGSGKTTFARYFIGASLGANPRNPHEVPSPTFTLVETYEPANGPAIWHFDLYRIEAPEDAYELGIEDAFADGIALIEWPERLGGLMPREHLQVALGAGKNDKARIAILSPSPGWADRVAGLKHG
jgi:tRNA threonylcarbamoyladenosine biosynthesis protein TsaE